MKIFVLSAAQRVIFTTLFMIGMNSLSVQSQNKVEVEKRVSSSDVPARVNQMVQPLLPDAKRVKYFQEFNRTDTSYEVKLKYNAKQLSIEFNSSGLFQDIESKIDFSSLNKNVKSAIKLTLTKQYTKFRVTRCQIQYTPKEKAQDPIALLMENEQKQMNILYEIEAKVKNSEGQIFSKEFLFNEKGQILKSRKIDDPQDDFLLY